MTIGSLCSGIGGLEMGLERAGLGAMPRHETYRPPGSERRLWVSRNDAANEVSLARKAVNAANQRLGEALRRQAHWDLAIKRKAGLKKANARRLVQALTDPHALVLCSALLVDLAYVASADSEVSGYVLTEAGRKEAERLRDEHPELSETPRSRGAESGT